MKKLCRKIKAEKFILTTERNDSELVLRDFDYPYLIVSFLSNPIGKSLNDPKRWENAKNHNISVTGKLVVQVVNPEKAWSQYHFSDETFQFYNYNDLVNKLKSKLLDAAKDPRVIEQINKIKSDREKIN